MNVRKFIQNKEIGFYLIAIEFLCTLVGVISFITLIKVSNESSEKPLMVITLATVTLALTLIAGYHDFFKVFTLATFVITTVTFFTFILGRVSYIAFLVSGDILGTGLSPFFVISTICYLASVVLSAMAMCFPQEKFVL